MNLVAFFYLFWYIISPAYATPPSGHASRASSILIDWSRMFCRGELPEGSYGETRFAMSIKTRMEVIACSIDNWNKANFSSLADLCTAHGNPMGNLGGQCTSDHRPIYNTRLAEAMLLYESNLEGHCRRHCFCPSDEDEWLRESQREAMYKHGLRFPPTSALPGSSSTRPPPINGISPDMDPSDPYNSRQGFSSFRKPSPPTEYFGNNWKCTVNPFGRDMSCGCRYTARGKRPPQPKERLSPYRDRQRLGTPRPLGLSVG